MIVLDENFTQSQRQLLKSWRIPIRQIGYEVGRAGMKDSEAKRFSKVVRLSSVGITFWQVGVNSEQRVGWS